MSSYILVLNAHGNKWYRIFFLSSLFHFLSLVLNPNLGPSQAFINMENKLWWIHTMAYYSALKRKKACFNIKQPWGHYAEWNESSQKCKYWILYISSFIFLKKIYLFCLKVSHKFTVSEDRLPGAAVKERKEICGPLV